MKRILTLLIFFGIFSNLYSQEIISLRQIFNDTIYSAVDSPPKFLSGNMYAWFGAHIVYPQSAINKGIEGKVFVSFVVEKDGSVSNVMLLRGVDSNLNAEALRVVSLMPVWNPGKLRGETVRVKFMVPINFALIDYTAYKVYCNTCVQKKPEFSKELRGYLRSHMAWDEDALRNHAQGKIKVSFIIEKNGSLSDIEVVSYDPGAIMLRHDAVRVIREMTDFQKWTPGYQDGHPVRVRELVTLDYVIWGNDNALYKVYNFDK